MDDRQYNNDGTRAGDSAPHVTPTEASYAPPCRRRFSWSRLALILIILGAALFAAGWMGGSRGGRIYFQGGTLRNFWGFEIQPENRDTGDAAVYNLPANVGDIRGITVNTNAANIVLRPSEGGNPRLVAYSDIEPDITFSNGILSINARQRERELGIGFPVLNFGTYRNELVLYMPSGTAYNAIELRSTSGNIRMDGFRAETLTAQSTSGNIRMDGFHAETLTARSNSGNMHMIDSNITDGNMQATSGNIYVTDGSILNLNAEARSGNITVDTTVLNGGNAEVRTTSGTIRFTGHNVTNGRQTPLNYNVRTSSGTIRVNGNRTGNNQTTTPNPGYSIEARANSGNIHLNFPAFMVSIP